MINKNHILSINTRVRNCIYKMTNHWELMKCTILVISTFVSITIFLALVLEEMLHENNIGVDNGPNNEEQFAQAKTEVYVISRVQLPNHNQEDPDLVNDLYSKILPPCKHTKEYKLGRTEHEGIGEFKHIRKLTNSKADRFFLECGARDGKSLTNTLYLEKNLYWKGLLVEADPAHFKNIITIHRKAWVAPVCMSLNTSAYSAYFKSSVSFEGKVVTNDSATDVVKVVCYPFYTFVLALGIKRIDYFSLSVSGHEMEILETIPFEKVYICFISVNVSKTRGGSESVTRFMTQHGFDLLKNFSSNELLFVNIDEDYW